MLGRLREALRKASADAKRSAKQSDKRWGAMGIGPLMLTSLLGCSVPAVRCPGEPLTTAQIQDIRNAQQAIRAGRGYAFQEKAAAEYMNMCGKLDPVTKEQ